MFIADKAFDSNAIIADLDARSAKVVISQHPRRAKPFAIDDGMHRWRHLIENFFGTLKEFKRIALRTDKTDQSFAAMIHIAAAVMNLNRPWMLSRRGRDSVRKPQITHPFSSSAFKMCRSMQPK
ncbi:transposase [Methylocystis sp. SC2]|uniref:transposase n=1 Tax=Methylocystis sp. (strain SC2) TaxID=187303 RepID=UPI00027AE88F|nr:transposase [Methylocystis sp. SC2]CCJ07933.1 Transposase IS4 family protein [Methylocystis sp. SC2]